MKSAASWTLHGKAIQKVNDRWGVCDETAVCKNKYTPFVTTKHIDPSTGRVSVSVTRTYGCHLHSDLRKNVIEKYGERRGWEPFGQWSLSKAKLIAKKTLTANNNVCQKVMESNESSENDNNRCCYVRPIGAKGTCVWKVKHKYDNIMEELSDLKQEQEELLEILPAKKYKQANSSVIENSSANTQTSVKNNDKSYSKKPSKKSSSSQSSPSR